MKTKSRRPFIILGQITLLALVASGCSQSPFGLMTNSGPGTPAPTNHIQLAISPLAPNAVKEQTWNFVTDFLERSAPGTQLSLYDGLSTHRIAQITVPTLEYDTAKARANAKELQEPLSAAGAFLRPKTDPPASVEPLINLSGLLRTLPPSKLGSVSVILGSAWAQPTADTGFSMLPDHRLPNDDHLSSRPLESPYGLAGYTNRLTGGRVIFAALGTPPSDRADEALRQFWAKSVRLAGASLDAYTRDVKFALDAALQPHLLAGAVETPPLELEGQLAMRSIDDVRFASRVAIVQFPGDMPVTRGDRPQPDIRMATARETVRDPAPVRPALQTQAPPRPLLTTNTVVDAIPVVQTNLVVATNFIRTPRVTSQVVTNYLTNWVVTRQLKTNALVVANTVYRTNRVVRTNFVDTTVIVR